LKYLESGKTTFLESGGGIWLLDNSINPGYIMKTVETGETSPVKFRENRTEGNKPGGNVKEKGKEIKDEGTFDRKRKNSCKTGGKKTKKMREE
jgi:hypothetical protein